MRLTVWTFCALLAACSDPAPPGASALQCDADNGGLALPPGFCALVVTDNLGNGRNIAVRGNGDIYVVTRNRRLGLGSLIALRDTDGDGRADEVQPFGDRGGVGLAIAADYLYLGSDDGIYRYALKAGELVPSGAPERVVGGFPEQQRHAGKALALDGAGTLFVNVGAPSNACQEENRQTGAPGRDPCPELERHAGIWRFDLHALQQQADGEPYAWGIRNAYALAWNPDAGALFAVQHGRDQLHELWPEVISEQQGSELPAEEFLRLQPSTAYAWPYCYFDHIQQRLVLAPEYGGDGRQQGRCRDFPAPLLGFPGHYGPNDLLFYDAAQFPSRYLGGAFVAFHGSYNRAREQAGFQVVFVPMAAGLPSGPWEVFADGFAGPGAIGQPEDALYRPTGLALGPDGSLYVLDSVAGRVWRILYRGA